MKVLTVEDNKIQQRLIKACLVSQGHEVMIASNGQEGIDCYLKDTPDFILMDVCMPNMDGFEAVKKIRALGGSEWIPIIFLSGTVSSDKIAKGIDSGGDDYISKPLVPEILSAKMRSMERINQMRRVLKENSQALRISIENAEAANEKLSLLHEEKSHQASHDPLTNLSNRVFFESYLDKAIASAKRYKDMLAVIFLDLDGFKLINDTLGHHEGDSLLKIVANRLQKVVRNTDLVARFGGDEFVILLPKINNPQDAACIAQIIIKVISNPYVLDHGTQFISASLGIALMPNDGEDVSSLIKHADIAMYDAKQKGKSNYQFHTHVLKVQTQKYYEIVNDLKIALRQEQFTVCFQPQIDFSANKIVAAETLVRWHHPQKGYISPAHFIPIAEKSKLVTLIDTMVFHKLCELLSKEKSLNNDFIVAFNVSANDLAQPNFINSLYSIIEKYNVEPSRIQLELTEGIFVNDIIGTKKILQKLKTYGLTLALDDFGTGYSCLSHLVDLPIDMLKIDKGFINNLHKDKKKQILVKTLISMAENLNIKIIAEGVEVNEQASFLSTEGCNLMQGYLFFKPICFQELVGIVKQGKDVSKYNKSG